MMKKVIWALAFVSIVSLVSSLCFPQGANASQLKIWDDGGADSNWSTPENWEPDGVPGPGDSVIFGASSNTDCIVDVPDVNIASLTLDSAYTSVLTLSYDFTVTDDLTVNSGTILCKGDTAAINEASGGTADNPHGSGVIITATNITVEQGAAISAYGLGFCEGQGPEPGNSYGEGGGHGGRGGSDGGHTYGSYTQPTALGSGGATGGIGGGAIKLNVSDTLIVNGAVSADGEDHAWGGGAGGSIWIITDTLAGSGSITADGGSAGSTDYRTGGGGGGRICLQWNSGKMNFDGTLRAKGGLKNNGNITHFGSHGTIYVYVPDNPDNSWKELWNVNNHVRHDIALPPGEYSFDELYIDSGVTLECQGDPDAVNVDSGGTADNPHGSGVIITASNITIEPDAAISAYGLGFCEGQGPEPGNSYGEGGGHGGRGGSDGGHTYGSYTQPTALGSGGATGGIGGGAIKLNVSDTLIVNGAVSADGEDHAWGGGAGGSIWIITDTLAGSGSITADGGAGTHPSDIRVTGGGGGRIAVYFRHDTSSLSATVSGGIGCGADGEPGTIIWEELCDESGVTGNICASPDTLWPPNHEMIPVTIDISGLVTHNPDTVISITSVDISEYSGQEAEETYGDDGNNFEPDYEITGDLTLNLRSERSGASTGRTYTVTVTATGCSGDYAFTTDVAVPHDKGT